MKEQVDAALGAEEMVEQLGEKKMELEDKVKLLEEEVAELEALEEVHEQLVESNHELELDLREELDMALAAKRDVNIHNTFLSIDYQAFIPDNTRNGCSNGDDFRS